jgi:2-amino-4-hydroxy-6-hydroxymethyldihydropteridine diphosphokinase
VTANDDSMIESMVSGPILIALGANLPSARFGPPRATCEAALEALAAEGVGIVARSPWYETVPVPLSDQPWYVNGVAEVTTGRSPEALLGLMQGIEARFGRVRREPNAARVLDLDLLAYGALVRPRPAVPELPHPRLHLRAFVLFPLTDLRPEWRHPTIGLSAAELKAALPPGQGIRRLE